MIAGHETGIPNKHTLPLVEVPRLHIHIVLHNIFFPKQLSFTCITHRINS